jgi:hypothetical protein
MNSKPFDFRIIKRSFRRARRPLMAVGLTIAFFKSFPFFLVLVLATAFWKIASQKAPAEFRSWR